MILEQQVTNVQTGGLMNPPKEFTIKASAKAFQILSDQIYTDKITAVIREICCNAHDAHIAAGKENVPFQVQLPTSLDPQFVVKDFGTGLSEENIYSLYATYFSSNKGDSDDFTGGFGIGSKAPFAYVNGFNVVSRFNGKKNTYMIFTQENTCPAVTKVSEIDTDEPNGLEISIPVYKSDFGNFIEKFQKTMEFFDPKPIVNLEVKFPQPVYDVRTEKWGVRKTVSYYHDSRIVLGHVSYPIPKMIDYVPIPNGIDLFASIGEAQVAASREALSLTEKTKKNILAKIEDLKDELFERSKDKVGEFTKVTDAIRYILSTSEQPLFSSHGIEEYYGVYPNFILDRHSGGFNEFDFKNLTVSEVRSSGNTTPYYYMDESQRRIITAKIASLKAMEPPVEYEERHYPFTRIFRKIDRFIVDDLRSGVRFAKRMSKDLGGRYVLLSGDQDDIHRFLKMMEVEDYVKTSELKLEYPDAKRNYTKTTGEVKVFRGIWCEKISEYWTSEPNVVPDDDNKIYYLPIQRFNIVGNNNDYVVKIYNMAKNVFHKQFTVYGLNEKQVKALQKEEAECIDFLEYVKREFKNLSAKMIDSAFVTCSGVFNSSQKKNFVLNIAQNKDLSVETRRMFASVHRFLLNKNSTNEEIKNLYYFVYGTNREAVDTSDDVLRKFPLLKELNTYSTTDDAEFLEYVCLKDKYGKKNI